MHPTILTPLSVLALCLFYLLVERIRLERARCQIPIRIHVNGTRGKSSVTRLIAGALRGGGLRAFAKTTGTLPRIIDDAGIETPITRAGPSTIGEQVGILAQVAATRRADALVIECMALRPEYQDVSERMIIQSTIGVITNVREDHLDVMGPTERDVALALCGSIPVGATLVTAERKYLPELEVACRVRGSRLVPVTEADVRAVPSDWMAAFTYFEHRENVALALKVAELAGVRREQAIEGMLAARPDPGALTVVRLAAPDGGDLVFVNGMAANDPQSSQMIRELGRRSFPDHDLVTLLNLRDDRSDRSRQLAEIVRIPDGARTEARREFTIVMGTGTNVVGELPGLLDLGDVQAAEVGQKLLDLAAGRRICVVGLGNVANQGLALFEWLRSHGSPVPCGELHAKASAPADPLPRSSSPVFLKVVKNG